MDDRKPAEIDLYWLAEWLRRIKAEGTMTTADLARTVKVTSQMLSQLKKPDLYGLAPGIELFWRLMAVYHEEPEWAGVSDERIRSTLQRVMASIGPARTHYLASISSSEAQAMIDEDQRKREARRRLEESREPGDGDDEKS